MSVDFNFLSHFERLVVRHSRVLCPDDQQQRRIIAVNIDNWTRSSDLFWFALVGKALLFYSVLWEGLFLASLADQHGTFRMSKDIS